MRRPARFVRRHKFLLLIVLIIVGIAAFYIVNRTQAQTLPALTVETVGYHDVLLQVSVDGKVRANDTRTISWPAQNKIHDLYYAVGDFVKKDSYVLRVETPTGFRTKIKSPIDGIITALNYKVGETITTQPLFTVADESWLLIDTQVNENDIAGVKNGQQVNLDFPAIGRNQIFQGTITTVAPDETASSGTVTYLVTVTPNTLPPGIKLGMSAEALILLDSRPHVLAVPSSYLIQNGQQYFVKEVIWQDAAKTKYDINQQEVKVGLQTDQYVEITSGLKEGQELVEPSFTVQRSFSFFGN